jgi:hypothetical protein
MQHPLVRARWLAPAILLAPVLLALVACSQPEREASLAARQAQMDPPALWLAQSFDADGKVTGAVQICADSMVRDGFTRGDEEVAGQPCLARKTGVERPGVYANRCELNGVRFGLTVNRTGDLEKDFTVAFALTALDGSGGKARQVRRYQKMGPCPAGWSIGDQAKPGEDREFNAVTGTWGS